MGKDGKANRLRDVLRPDGQPGTLARHRHLHGLVLRLSTYPLHGMGAEGSAATLTNITKPRAHHLRALNTYEKKIKGT